MRLLMDTHALLWHFVGGSMLSQTAGNALNNRDNQLFISSASLWEISIKVGLGKLELLYPVEEMVAGYVRTGSILLPVLPGHAMAAGSLPWHHRDPFDRVLIIQARLEKLTIVSRDELFDPYEVTCIW